MTKLIYGQLILFPVPQWPGQAMASSAYGQPRTTHGIASPWLAQFTASQSMASPANRQLNPSAAQPKAIPAHGQPSP
jgi:hypothetical protein